MREKKSFCYYLFLFLTTFTRGLIEVFSLVLLYRKGYSVSELFFFLFILYSVGLLVNYLSLKIPYKKVLIVSSLLYGGSFLYLSWMKNTLLSLILLGILLSFSNYSYHAVRHYLACKLIDRKKTYGVVTIMYFGTIVSSIVGVFLIEKLPLIWSGVIIFLCSFIGIFPILRMKELKKEQNRFSILKVKIEKNKVMFSIFEQFKVMFLELQPLFLFLYVKGSIYYVGIFQVVVNVASFVVVYFLSKRIGQKYFRVVCFGLAVIFVLKLNIKSGMWLLGLAFLEGVAVKIYENISLGNLYDVGNNDIKSYLLLEEFIFFGSKSLFMLLVIVFHMNLYLVLYLCIIGIIISGYWIRVPRR